MKKAWHQQTKRAPKEARTSRDGILFASKGELQYWEKLKLWQLAGEIRNLKRQVSFPLVSGEIKVLTETGKVAIYTADFVFERKIASAPHHRGEMQIWQEIIADYKGYAGKMEMFRIRVFEALYNKKVTIVR